MSMMGDIARENAAQFLCQKIVEKIEKYPTAEKALKETGIEVLAMLPNIPDWARHYYKIFNN